MDESFLRSARVPNHVTIWSSYVAESRLIREKGPAMAWDLSCERNARTWMSLVIITNGCDTRWYYTDPLGSVIQTESDKICHHLLFQSCAASNSFPISNLCWCLFSAAHQLPIAWPFLLSYLDWFFRCSQTRGPCYLPMLTIDKHCLDILT